MSPVVAEQLFSPTAKSLLAAVGSTPLVELDPGPEAPRGTRLLAKLEGVNPGGSIKDRPVARMLTRALGRGDLNGRRLLDSSSGNAGIAYAQFGAALGIEVTLVVPANASRERLERIAAHGAELILTDPVEGYDHAVETARRLARDRPDLYWHADQYANPGNWQAHYESTAPEILNQVSDRTGRPPDVFVAGVGTGGTITGVGRRLREELSEVKIASVIPELFPGIEGLKPLGRPEDLVPEILDESLIDRRIEVTLDDAAATVRELSRHGLFVGPSSGAFVWAARRLAAESWGPVIVTILSDSGERYGSTGLWERHAGTGMDLPTMRS